MSVLIIDVGNTRIKWAVYIDGTFSLLKSTTDHDIDASIQQNNQLESVNSGICVNVRNDIDLAWLSKLRFPVHVLSRKDRFPFVNKYATPETLGIDRMVLAAGAVLLFPKENRLVIDAGTCLTFDFVNSKDEYLGGSISPGLSMRYRAMNEFTAKLPLLTPEYPKSIFGDSTFECLHVGASWGIIAEIDAYIEQVCKVFGNIKIILTGGDADFLAKQSKNRIFANSNFLLESLLSIYEYQNQNP